VPSPVAAPAGGTEPGGGTAVATAPSLAPARPPFLAGDMPDGPVQVMSWNCSQVEGMEPQGLGMTYWFDAAPAGDAYPVSVRFTGRRVSGEGNGGGKTTFETVRTIQRVVPGSGRVALTSRVPELSAGTWEVTATPVVLTGADGSPAQPPPPIPMPQGSSSGATAFLPVVNVRAPGVRIGAWPALVGLGFVAAVILQWVLGVQRDLPVGRILLVSLLAGLVGLVGAKVYYLQTHRAEKKRTLTAGMSVQGFVMAAVSVLVLAGWVAGIAVGAMLDVTAPGLLLGMTIGRLGCFFGGCCVGLPTASRWGIWSSDRGVGVRRVPVQLFESAMAGTVATLTLLAVLLLDPAVDGLLFLAGLSAYTLGRQVLFPLRVVPRKTANGRVITAMVTGLVLVASVVGLLVS
jgi:phosphatidylglycerol:prolipoprotein diacylglycerol transferase